jgi:hypothetical protein
MDERFRDAGNARGVDPSSAPSLRSGPTQKECFLTPFRSTEPVRECILSGMEHLRGKYWKGKLSKKRGSARKCDHLPQPRLHLWGRYLPLRFDQIARRFDPIRSISDPIRWGFDPIRSIFERIRSGFDQIRSIFDQIRSIIDRIRSIFDRIRSRFDRIHSIFDQIHSILDQIRSGFDRIRSIFDQIQRRVLHRFDHLRQIRGRAPPAFLGTPACLQSVASPNHSTEKEGNHVAQDQ